MKKWLIRTSFCFTILICGEFASAQKVIQEGATITARMDERENGPASVSAHLEYLVRRMDNQVIFSITFTRVDILAEAGFYHKGNKYGSEVPGLMGKLNALEGNYPTVNFDIYYGAVKQGSFTLAISARNNLNIFTGDIWSFNTSIDKLDNPNWSLVATGLQSFNYSPDPLAWRSMIDLIEKNEQEKKEKEDYTAQLSEADRLFNARQYKEASSLYLKVSKSPLADSYPALQLEKIRTLMAQDEKEASFRNFISQAEEAEKDGDLAVALSNFQAAGKTGVGDFRAEAGVNRVERAMEDKKRQQEEELKAKQKESERILEEKMRQQEKEADKTDKILDEKNDDLERQNDKEEEKLKDELEKADRKKLNEELKEKNRQREEERKRQEEEEERQIKKAQQDRRDDDKEDIEAYEANMSYNPVLYEEFVAKGDKQFDKGMSLDPNKALELKKDWWDTNPYMESFREDLNEPKRKEAWQNSLYILYDMESYFASAKFDYIMAIHYTDKNSKQHRYLLGQIEMMNMMIDFQQAMIKRSQENEERRQENYEKSRVNIIMNRMGANAHRASQMYQIMIQNQSYTAPNGKAGSTESMMQQQLDFERRLNEADKQLQQDNLITGVTSQVAVNAMLDDSKTARSFRGRHAGVNIFAFSGVLNYPVIANDVPKQGYVPETIIRGLTVIPFQAGFDLWLHRGKTWDLGITPDFVFGVLPMMGNSNLIFNYGVNVKLSAGISRVKLAFEADYHNRYGSYNYDQDVALSQFNNPFLQPTNRILEGEFNYSVLKGGAGLNIDLSDAESDSYLRLMMYGEKPSFYNDFRLEKPVLSFGAQMMFHGGITLTFNYSKNYPAAGTANNVMSEYTDSDLLNFTFGKTWSLGKKQANQ
jgi:hypothetical protein